MTLLSRLLATAGVFALAVHPAFGLPQSASPTIAPGGPVDTNTVTGVSNFPTATPLLTLLNGMLQQTGGTATGPLSSISTITTALPKGCLATAGAFATDGTQSWVPSCFGTFVGNAPGAFTVYATRGTSKDANGNPTSNVTTPVLIQAQASGAIQQQVNGQFINMDVVGGASSAAGDVDNSTGQLISLRQHPDASGNKPPAAWGQNIDLHIAPNSGNTLSMDAELDLNNFNKDCGIATGCNSWWLWFNGVAAYSNLAMMYGGGANTQNFTGTATTSGNTITIVSGTIRNDIAYVVLGTPVSTTSTAASTTTSIPVSSATNISPGETISGAGVTSPTTVVSVSGSTVTASRAVNIASGAALTFSPVSYRADYVDSTHLKTDVTLPTNTSAVAFTANIAQSHYGYFLNGLEQVKDADLRFGDAARISMQIAGYHNTGIDTTADALFTALNLASPQSICFNNADKCLSYGGGFLNYKQGSAINWFIDGGGNNYANGFNAQGTTASTSATTGAITDAGGLGVAGAANIGGALADLNTTDSSSSTTGSITTNGGLGVAKALYVGTTVNTPQINFANGGVGAAVPTGLNFTASNIGFRTPSATGTYYFQNFNAANTYGTWSSSLFTSNTEVSFIAAEDHAMTTVTASFTYDATMHNIVAGSRATPLTAAVVGALPACVTAVKNRTYGLKKVDTSTNAVTLTAATTNAQTSTADLIDGAATVALTAQYAQVNVQCDGAGNWWRGLY